MKTTTVKPQQLPDPRKFKDLNEWLNAWEGDVSDDDDYDYDDDDWDDDDDDWDDEDYDDEY